MILLRHLGDLSELALTPLAIFIEDFLVDFLPRLVPHESGVGKLFHDGCGQRGIDHAESRELPAQLLGPSQGIGHGLGRLAGRRNDQKNGFFQIHHDLKSLIPKRGHQNFPAKSKASIDERLISRAGRIVSRNLKYPAEKAMAIAGVLMGRAFPSPEANAIKSVIPLGSTPRGRQALIATGVMMATTAELLMASVRARAPRVKRTTTQKGFPPTPWITCPAIQFPAPVLSTTDERQMAPPYMRKTPQFTYSSRSFQPTALKTKRATTAKMEITAIPRRAP